MILQEPWCPTIWDFISQIITSTWKPIGNAVYLLYTVIKVPSTSQQMVCYILHQFYFLKCFQRHSHVEYIEDV